MHYGLKRLLSPRCDQSLRNGLDLSVGREGERPRIFSSANRYAARVLVEFGLRICSRKLTIAQIDVGLCGLFSPSSILSR